MCDTQAALRVDMPLSNGLQPHRHVWAQLGAHLGLPVHYGRYDGVGNRYRVSFEPAGGLGLTLTCAEQLPNVRQLRVHRVEATGRCFCVPAAQDKLAARLETDGWHVDGDPVGALAGLLTLREEHEIPYRDQFGLVQGQHSPRHAMGVLSEPLFENTAEWIRHLLAIPPMPVYPGGATWAVAVSCDVDVLTNDHLGEVLSFLQRHRVHRPTFFICSAVGDERTIRDPEYDVTRKASRSLLEPLRTADVEIGLHGSYLAHDRVDPLVAQRKRLEDWCGRPVAGHRAHYYRFAYPRSWAWQYRAGLSYDCSLGYPDLPGFRSGCASPTLFYDPEDGWVRFAMFPTAVLDQHFYWPAAWGVKEFEAYVASLFDRVSRMRGALVVDWHTYTLNPAFGWWSRLEHLLGQARQAGAYVAGVGAILEHHWARWNRCIPGWSPAERRSGLGEHA